MSGSTALLVAASELSLVRSLRAAMQPTASAPQQPLPKLKYNSEPRFEPRPVIHPEPRVEFSHVALKLSRTQSKECDLGINYNQPSPNPANPVQTASSEKAVEPSSKVLGYKPEPALPEQKIMKVTLLRTDTHHRGAFIDFFC